MEIVPVIVHSLSVSSNALLAPEILDLGNLIFHRWTELVPPSLDTIRDPNSSQQRYCLCQSESNLAFPIQPFPLLCHLKYFPMPLSPPPISPSQPAVTVVTASHRPDPLLGPTSPTRAWVRVTGKVSVPGMRSDLAARPSSLSPQTPACSLYYPLARAREAKMKYIADYPADAGSLTRLDGPSGQGSTDISPEKCP